MIISTRRTGQASGFTLFELVIVLAIISTLAALVAPRVTQLPKRTVPPVVEFLEAERQRSIATATGTRILFDGQVLTSTATGETYTLAPEDQLQVLEPEANTYLADRQLTAFYADGTMTTTRIRFSTPSLVYLIETSPFAQRVRYTITS